MTTKEKVAKLKEDLKKRKAMLRGEITADQVQDDEITIDTSKQEAIEIEQGKLDKQDNPLKNAPHTAEAVTAAEWKHSYSRERAAFPAPWTREHKYWPPIARVNDVHGDRNVICTCPPLESYEAAK